MKIWKIDQPVLQQFGHITTQNPYNLSLINKTQPFADTMYPDNEVRADSYDMLSVLSIWQQSSPAHSLLIYYLNNAPHVRNFESILDSPGTLKVHYSIFSLICTSRHTSEVYFRYSTSMTVSMPATCSPAHFYMVAGSL